MIGLSDKKQKSLIWIIYLVYTSTYLAKLNYNGILISILEDLSGTKSAAGLVSSCFFFAYGIGQFINGFLTKFYNEKWVITISLAMSALCNFGMSLAPSLSAMKYIWLVNGFVLSTLWCLTIKTISKYISGNNMHTALVIIGTTTPVGTAVNYGLCALIAAVASWKNSFHIGGILMLVMAGVWFFTISRVEGYAVTETTKSEKEEEKRNKTEAMKRFALTVIGATFIIAMVSNFMRDGLVTWAPNIFHDLYHMPDYVAIILTLVVPLVGTLSNFLAVMLEKKLHDIFKIVMIFICVAAAFMAVLVFTYKLYNPIIGIVCITIVSFCCMGIVNSATSLMPIVYRDIYDSGRVAGLGEGFCYVGSTVATYTLGLVADKGNGTDGWYNGFVLLLWMIVAAFVFCFVLKIITDRLSKKVKSN